MDSVAKRDPESTLEPSRLRIFKLIIVQGTVEEKSWEHARG